MLHVRLLRVESGTEVNRCCCRHHTWNERYTDDALSDVGYHAEFSGGIGKHRGDHCCAWVHRTCDLKRDLSIEVRRNRQFDDVRVAAGRCTNVRKDTIGVRAIGCAISDIARR